MLYGEHFGTDAGDEALDFEFYSRGSIDKFGNGNQSPGSGVFGNVTTETEPGEQGRQSDQSHSGGLSKTGMIPIIDKIQYP